MKVEVNIEKKYAYVLIGFAIALICVVAVGAYNNPIPNPGHGADTIIITAGGVEKSLQTAINEGDIVSKEKVSKVATGLGSEVAYSHGYPSQVRKCPSGYVLTGWSEACGTDFCYVQTIYCRQLTFYTLP